MSADKFQLLAWLMMMAVFAAFLVFRGILSNYLKRKNLPIWQEIESPSLFWSNALRRDLLFTRYLVRRDYAFSGDRKLVIIGTATLVLWWVLLALVVANIGIFWML